MSRHTLCLALILGIAGCRDAPASEMQPSTAGRYASLYTDSTLRYWRGRFAPTVRYYLDTLIVLNSLAPTDRARLRGLSLYLPEREERDPLTFQIEGSPPTITVSAMSLKFLDDMTIALSWLIENGYSVETVAHYAAVLKYRPPSQFEGGRYPAPLPALGIPANALSDRSVDDASQKLLKTAVVFILAHEVGHAVHGDTTAVSASASQARELAADRFALDVFRQIGTPPAGVATLFFVLAHLSCHPGDFSDSAEWTKYAALRATHPLSGARLRAVAADLRRRPQQFVHAEPNPDRALTGLATVTREIESMAPLVDDELVLRHASILGRLIPLTELRPRRPGNTWIPRDSVIVGCPT